MERKKVRSLKFKKKVDVEVKRLKYATLHAILYERINRNDGHNKYGTLHAVLLRKN